MSSIQAGAMWDDEVARREMSKEQGGDVMRAWYFARDNFTSGQCKPLADHMTVELPLVLCSHGLHASRRIHDALYYARGTLLCRTEHSGDILEQHDKLCSQERRFIAKADATRILHEHALWCAEFALGFVDEARRDPRSLEALRIKRLWLDGKATNKELRKTRDAASDAASAASAAWAAWAASDASAASAVSAAWAAKDAARAARDAARDAAWAARDAAWGAARAAVDDDIEQRALELLGCE